MTIPADTHLSYTIIAAPFDRVAPIIIGTARALWGHLALHPGNRTRARDFERQQAKRLARARHAIATPSLGIRAADRQTLLEDWSHEAIAPAISAQMPGIPCLAIGSFTEGKVRTSQSLALYRDGARHRSLSADKGCTAKGWTWIEDGPVQPWEEPVAYGAPAIEHRLTRQSLWEAARNFGCNIEAVMNAETGPALLIEFLSDFDPEVEERQSSDHMDISRAAVAAGLGDPLNLEPPDAAGAAQILQQMGSPPSG